MIQVILRIVKGPETGKQFTFKDPDRFLIGRAANAHFRFAEADPYISRNHCLLEICPPNVYLRDLKSTNGTRVNGAKVQEACLTDGAQIRLGVTILEVKLETIPDAARPPADDEAPPPLLPRLGREEPRQQAASKCVKCNKTAASGKLPDQDWATLLYLCDACAAALPKDPKAKPLGQYRLLGELGRGGMGVVYKGRHTPSGRLVAIKKMLAVTDKRAAQLFEREMKVLRAMRHTNIARILDQGTDGNECYFVSEFVDGGDLGRLVAETRRAPLDVVESCRYIRDVLKGLEWAHQQGYVHRDVKPPNILLAGDGPGKWRAKLTDFGLAKSFAEAGASFMTQRGEWCGTLLFMAPEQILNYRYVKPPADLYSVGVTLYYLLTGRLPFEFPSELDRAMGRAPKKPKDEVRIILEDEPIPIRTRNKEVPEKLAAVVDRSIRKREAERFQTAGELLAAIDAACK